MSRKIIEKSLLIEDNIIKFEIYLTFLVERGKRGMFTKYDKDGGLKTPIFVYL